MSDRFAVLEGNRVSVVVTGISQPVGSIALDTFQEVAIGSIWDGEQFLDPDTIDQARLTLARQRLLQARSILRQMYQAAQNLEATAQARSQESTVLTLAQLLTQSRQQAGWIASLANGTGRIARMLLDLGLILGMQMDDGVE